MEKELSRVEEVIEKHNEGYNCAQAVACVYCEEFNISEQEAFRAMSSFGLGMGSMGTCGAVSAMVYLSGLKVCDGLMGDSTTKASCYKIAKTMTNKFVEKNQSTECKVIKGVDTGKILCSCDDCMKDCASIVESHLFVD